MLSPHDNPCRKLTEISTVLNCYNSPSFMSRICFFLDSSLVF